MQNFRRLLAAFACLVVGLASFALSYVALRDVAVALEAVPPYLGWLVPIVIDGGIICGSAIIWSLSKEQGGRPKFPFFFVGSMVLMSVVVNVAHAGDSILAKIIAALPPLILLGTLELVADQGRKAKSDAEAVTALEVAPGVEVSPGTQEAVTTPLEAPRALPLIPSFELESPVLPQPRSELVMPQEVQASVSESAPVSVAKTPAKTAAKSATSKTVTKTAAAKAPAKTTAARTAATKTATTRTSATKTTTKAAPVKRAPAKKAESPEVPDNVSDISEKSLTSKVEGVKVRESVAAMNETSHEVKATVPEAPLRRASSTRTIRVSASVPEDLQV